MKRWQTMVLGLIVVALAAGMHLAGCASDARMASTRQTMDAGQAQATGTQGGYHDPSVVGRWEESPLPAEQPATSGPAAVNAPPPPAASAPAPSRVGANEAAAGSRKNTAPPVQADEELWIIARDETRAPALPQSAEPQRQAERLPQQMLHAEMAQEEARRMAATEEDAQQVEQLRQQLARSRAAGQAQQARQLQKQIDFLDPTGRFADAAEPDPAADILADPGSGAMIAVVPLPDKAPKRIPLPLEHTDVEGDITGYIATVDVTQKFGNPYDSRIEAVYVFPLPQDAAINEFVMTIGDRTIRGIIRERQEAERIYREARSQGYRAALLTQERPNIFTQKVANIEPGKAIDVHIRYFHTLSYRDGWYAWTFPMVVGPRFNPPDAKDPVRPLPRGTQGPQDSGRGTNVHYLKPDERSGHDIALSVNLDAGVPIEELACNTHEIDVSDGESPSQKTIAIAAGDTLPNKDFVLRFRVAGDRIKSSLVTHESERAPENGYFTLMVYPPKDLASLPRHPMEMVFVLDCSGSMNGQPIAQVKAAVTHALGQLTPEDTFQIIRFSDNASSFGRAPVPATEQNIQRAIGYVQALHGSGGTMMIEGIRAALDFPHDDNRLRFVCFMTDGFIGNEAQILRAVHEKIGDSRIFSFGVGSSPNRYLLDRMAKLGRGVVAYLGLHDDGAKVMDRFFTRVSHPALTDLSIDWNGLTVRDVFPQTLPDLFVGRPVILTGRYAGRLPDAIRITGEAMNEPIEMVVQTGDAAAEHPSLAAVWARHQIKDLMDQATHAANADELAGRIQQLALDYNLMSAYTAFLAVDSSRRTTGTHGTTVHQAVPVPEGVKYETTVMGE